MFRCVALAACLLTSAAQAAPSILATAQEDRTVILKDGRIAAVGDASVAVPDEAEFSLP